MAKQRENFEITSEFETDNQKKAAVADRSVSDDGSLQEGSCTAKCQNNKLTITLIILVIFCLFCLAALALGFSITLYVQHRQALGQAISRIESLEIDVRQLQQKHCVNQTVYVMTGSGEGNSSNNSLRIELDDILSTQDVLKSEQRSLRLLVDQFADRVSSFEANTRSNVSYLEALVQSNTQLLANVSEQQNSLSVLLVQFTDRVTSFEANTRENVSYLEAAVESNTQLLANLTEHVLFVRDVHGDRLTIVSSLLSNFSNELALIDGSVDRLNSNQNAQQRDIDFLRSSLINQAHSLFLTDGRIESLQEETDAASTRVTGLEGRITVLENSGDATHPLPLLTILCWSFVIHIIVSYVTNSN